VKPRALLLYGALLCYVLVVGLEIGEALLGAPSPAGDLLGASNPPLVAPEIASQIRTEPTPPGRALPALALFDVLCLLTLALMSLSQVLPAIAGRITGVASLIVSVGLVIAAIGTALACFVEVQIMLALFLAVPFGTLVYIGKYGFFDVSGSAGLIEAILGLKLLFAILMLIAQPTLLIRNKSFAVLILVSIGLTLVTDFLHSFPPMLLVSITDRIGSIVIALVASIWALLVLIGSLPAIAKAVRSFA